MSRSLRIQYPDAWYHVMNRGRLGEEVFETREDSLTFAERIKDKFFDSKHFDEIPEAKRLAPNIDKIKGTVCKVYNIEEPDLYVSRRGYFNEPRNVAVYLTRVLRNDALKVVGEQFRIEKYSTVSSIVEKVKYEMKADKGLKKRIQNLIAIISNSQRKT